jgi:hypothetical protein
VDATLNPSWGAGGPYPVKVRNPTNQESNVINHSISEPTPTLTNIDPDYIYYGHGARRINFTGTGFRGSAGTVSHGGYNGNVPCTFTSATAGYVDLGMINTSPNSSIAVRNNSGNTGWSNSLPFTGLPGPDYGSINPASGTLADQKQSWDFIVYGNNFLNVNGCNLELHQSGWKRWAQYTANGAQSLTQMNINDMYIGCGAGWYNHCTVGCWATDANNGIHSEQFAYQLLAGMMAYSIDSASGPEGRGVDISPDDHGAKLLAINGVGFEDGLVVNLEGPVRPRQLYGPEGNLMKSGRPQPKLRHVISHRLAVPVGGTKDWPVPTFSRILFQSEFKGHGLYRVRVQNPDGDVSNELTFTR